MRSWFSNLFTQDRLRRRFGMALQYYQLLSDSSQETVRSSIELARATIQRGDTTAPSRTLEELAANPMTRTYFTAPEHHQPEANGSRPSAYLRARCPLCFGATTYQNDGRCVSKLQYFEVYCYLRIHRPNVFISGDACFTQKREHDAGGVHDPPLGDPVVRELFISREDCNRMEAYEIRAKSASKRVHKHDLCVREAGVAIPNEVLNLCKESYDAANEQCAKASGTYFEDTGIMAVVCRHDRIIFLANLTTPGERRFYMLALVDKIFQELPSYFIVGFLYDIACQFHRTMSKVCRLCSIIIIIPLTPLSFYSGTCFLNGLNE
jgi:hypothetical protein